MSDTEDHHPGSFAGRARSALSRIGQDEHVKSSADVAKAVAAQAEEVSKNVSRKVAQEDAWEELRGDVGLLTDIARAHHALIVDLIDRVAELEAKAGGRDDA